MRVLPPTFSNQYSISRIYCRSTGRTLAQGTPLQIEHQAVTEAAGVSFFGLTYLTQAAAENPGQGMNARLVQQSALLQHCSNLFRGQRSAE